MDRIDQKVSVLNISNPVKAKVGPLKIVWNGRSYTTKEVGLHHKYYKGRTLIHVYSITAISELGLTFMRLELNTDNQFWTLIEVNNEVK